MSITSIMSRLNDNPSAQIKIESRIYGAIVLSISEGKDWTRVVLSGEEKCQLIRLLNKQ
jgi:hypothetical protein